MLYFAYGSNMLAARLQQRVPSAVAISTGYIHQHHLIFNKLGKDGSGKGNIAPHPVQRVYGVIYQMNVSERWRLDEAESLGLGYEHCWLEVQSSLGDKKILSYRAIKMARGLLPYSWYRDLILHGAIAHALPSAYIASLVSIPTIKDPDADRRQHHQSLLKMGTIA